MPSNYKGLPEVYQFVCEIFQKSFYEWLPNNSNLCSGQLCFAPAWYEKKCRWYFTDGNYDVFNESESTWKAKIFTGEQISNSNTYVKKYFELEKDEYLLGTHGKYRPVIIVKNYISNWPNPANIHQHENKWLCLPIFSYKEKHNQEYVLDDLCFNKPHQLYLPQAFKTQPGLDHESALRFEAIQMVNNKYLVPIKCLNTSIDVKLKQPFKLSEFALRIIMYHFMKHLDLFNEQLLSDGIKKNEYDVFVEAVKEYLSECS